VEGSLGVCPTPGLSGKKELKTFTVEEESNQERRIHKPMTQKTKLPPQKSSKKNYGAKP